jgi:hypothetical protein
VAAQNENMILDFLNNYPQELKWVNIYFFDFTKDGEMEIVLSTNHEGLSQPVMKIGGLAPLLF